MTMRMYAELFFCCNVYTLTACVVRLPFKFVLLLFFLDFLQRRTCIKKLEVFVCDFNRIFIVLRV